MSGAVAEKLMELWRKLLIHKIQSLFIDEIHVLLPAFLGTSI
jgi:replicative superfamily II helicase